MAIAWSRISSKVMANAPPEAHLSIQPHLGDAAAVVEGEVVGKVLQIRLPGTGDHHREQIHIVLLLRGIALKVGQDLFACLWILRASLLLHHGCELGVVDMSAV